MNNRRTKRLPIIILSQLLVGLFILTVSYSIIFFAQGNRFNLKTFKIVRTGVLYLSSYPKGGDIYLNGQLQEEKTPFTKNLKAGNYTAEIRKDGYITWADNFKIESQKVANFKAIVLIKSDVVVSDLTDSRKISLLDDPIDTLAVQNSDKALVYNDYEIWESNNLVTRFSTPLQKAIWYSDKEHILFQQGAEIHIIDKDGSNNILLVTLLKSDLTRFAINDKGDELYFVDDGQYKMARIRDL